MTVRLPRSRFRLPTYENTFVILLNIYIYIFYRLVGDCVNRIFREIRISHNIMLSTILLKIPLDLIIIILFTRITRTSIYFSLQAHCIILNWGFFINIPNRRPSNVQESGMVLFYYFKNVFSFSVDLYSMIYGMIVNSC